MKTILRLLWISILFAGCTRHYYINETQEPDESAKRARVQEFERILKSAKVDDPLAITLYNGTLIEGNFYSYAQGILSIRVDDTFRDTELSDVRGMSFKSESRQIKSIVYVLAGLGTCLIVYTFIKNH